MSRAGRAFTTRALLISAVFGAVTGLVALGLTPLNTFLALAAPLVYAAVASITATGGMLALRWTRTPGAAIVTGLLTGLLVSAASPLGGLAIIAYLVPAAAVEAVFFLFRYRLGSVAAWIVAPAAGGIAIAALSLAVIEPTLLTPAFVTALFIIRILAYIACGAVSLTLLRALERAGLRSLRPRNERNLSR